MTSVVFDTPGLIDIRAFTSFGVNSKPMTNSPIGYFGTGLKYAIAVLVREGLQVELWIGHQDKYTFYKSTNKFRDKSFDFIRMKKESWTADLYRWAKPRYDELPFTTELGKNWQLWEAFRELYTNTLDENGQTYIYDPSMMQQVTNNQTRIQVTGQAFVSEFYDRDKNFLPDGLRQRTGTERLQVFHRPSNHIYYRGMRIHDLKRPSTLTYNLLCEVKLTENRQAASVYDIEQEIAQYILSSENEEEIKTVLQGEDTYESRINYHLGYGSPSRSFLTVAKGITPTNHTAAAIVRSHEPRRAVANPLDNHPRPWRQSLIGNNVVSILDARSNLVMDLVLDSNSGEPLSSEAVRYIVALLQLDLDDQAFNDWVKERPADLSLTDAELEADIREKGFQPASLSVGDDDDVVVL